MHYLNTMSEKDGEDAQGKNANCIMLWGKKEVVFQTDMDLTINKLLARYQQSTSAHTLQFFKVEQDDCHLV